MTARGNALGRSKRPPGQSTPFGEDTKPLSDDAVGARTTVTAALSAEVAWQRFSVPYEYPVAFTRGLFSPNNPLLAEMLARREPDKRHRALVYLDDGLARARPGFGTGIEAYAAAHADRIALAAPVETVAGGEKIKTELTWIVGIQDRIHGLGIDRHSFVIERFAYTVEPAELMAELNPPGAVVSLSTVPGTFKPLAAGREQEMAVRMLAAAAHLHGIREHTGVTVGLAVEPEPFCFLETIDEAVAFFERHLLSEDAAATLASLTGLTRGDAAAALPRHLGLCYDVCHAAVEYEDPSGSIDGLRAAGVPVHKLQLSAALRIPSVDAAARRRLAAFDEPTYLHQVVSRRGCLLRRELDLGPALARSDSDSDGEEWRVHFHVPLSCWASRTKRSADCREPSCKLVPVTRQGGAGPAAGH